MDGTGEVRSGEERPGQDMAGGGSTVWWCILWNTACDGGDGRGRVRVVGAVLPCKTVAQRA